MCAEAAFPRFEFFNDPSSLIYGIGNVGRRDDGLGWAFVDRLEARQPLPRAVLHRNYQLNFEDADLICEFARVLFVDATKDPAVSSFSLTRPEPKLDFSFTSHAISVPSILATAKQCFGYLPEVYLLAIRGYEWELQMGLTEPAEQNLRRRRDFARQRWPFGQHKIAVCRVAPTAAPRIPCVNLPMASPFGLGSRRGICVYHRRCGATFR